MQGEATPCTLWRLLLLAIVSPFLRTHVLMACTDVILQIFIAIILEQLVSVVDEDEEDAAKVRDDDTRREEAYLVQQIGVSDQPLIFLTPLASDSWARSATRNRRTSQRTDLPCYPPSQRVIWA